MRKLYKRPSSKLVLALFMSFEIAVAPALAHTNAQSITPNLLSQNLSNQLNSESDPLWQEFAEAQPTNFKLSFSADDPAIDQDPYFMRSQQWKSHTHKSSVLSFLKSTSGLEISLPYSSKTLFINLPLLPIQATSDYIFLSLDANSDLFKKAAGISSAPGEGIFFLSRADLEQQALDEKPAPIFFFPLAGQGWTGQLSSLEISQIETLVVANQTVSVPLELRDVETVMKAQKINLMIASALSAKNRGKVTKEMYPAAGMTAAFGLFFTGIDLKRPEYSMWPAQQTQSEYKDSTWYQPLLKKVSYWLPVALSPAQAFELSPRLMDRLVFVGSVLTGMLAASVVIKYAHPGIRKKLKEQRSQQELIKNPLKLAQREVKETFDVFAAITSTTAQVASVTFANSLELFLDRFAPTLAAADHTLVRRFLNNTFYFSRNAMRNVPVNSRTFVLGAIVMGGVDTAMVHIQYEYAVPLIAQTAAHQLGQSMQNRINESFDITNPRYKQIALEDTVRNGISHTLNGASGYSMDAKAQVIESITKEVEDDMTSRGVDPAAPQNQTEKENLINKKINIVMKQKGLPDKNQFLFDASTIFSNIPKTLGYKTTESMQSDQSFILEKRFGLSENALKKSILVATEWVKNDNSETSREALSLLEETLASMSFLKNGISQGREGLAKARAARQQLTLLSYEGSVEYAIKFIPETWSQKYSPQAAQAAAVMFRQSLYSYLSAEGDDLLFVNKKNVEKYGETAKEIAMQELKQAHPEMTDSALKSSEMQFELKLRTQMAINNLARAQVIKEKADSFKPPTLDWMARRKQAHALKQTDIQMTNYLNSVEGAKASDEQLTTMKQKIFRDTLAKQIGLYIEDRDVAAIQGREDYIKMIDFVEKKSVDSTNDEITTNPDMRRYFDKLSTPEKEKIKMFIYANKFFKNYTEATTSLEMVKPTDAAQPGRFQKLRQTEVVRNSAFLTRTLRTFESFGNDQSIELGLSGALLRNIPLANDLFETHKRMMKTILPGLTVSYLWNFFAWQVHMPFASWAIFAVAAAATISTPSMWLNRVFRLNGMKPKGGIVSMIAYSLPYAWVTFAGMFPLMLFSGDASVLFSDYIRTPVLSVLDRVDIKDWIIGALGLGLITKKIKEQAEPNFNKKSQEIEKIVNLKQRPLRPQCINFFE